MRYMIIDNDRPYQNTVIEADNRSNAMDKGASILKTFNIRCTPTNAFYGTINSRTGQYNTWDNNVLNTIWNYI